MRTIKTLLLAVVIIFGSVLTANAKTEPTKDQQAIIAKRFERILKYPEFDVNKETLVKVTFMFNNDNEMVILSVDSKNKDVSSFIKTTFNYQGLSLDGMNKNEEYVLPIRLIPYGES